MDRELQAKLAGIQELIQGGKTAGEVEAATQAFNRLIAKHNISEAELARLDGAPAAQYVLEKVRVAKDNTDGVTWRKELIHVIAHFNFVQVLYPPRGTGMGRGKAGIGGGIVSLIGQPSNIAAVKQLFSTMAPHLEVLALRAYEKVVLDWKLDHPHLIEYAKEFTPNKRTYMVSWLRGFPSGLFTKLYEERRAQEQDTSTYTGLGALVVVKGQELKQAVRDLVGRTSQATTWGARDGSAFRQGHDTGRSWSSNTQVSATSTRALGSGR